MAKVPHGVRVGRTKKITERLGIPVRDDEMEHLGPESRAIWLERAAKKNLKPVLVVMRVGRSHERRSPGLPDLLAWDPAQRLIRERIGDWSRPMQWQLALGASVDAQPKVEAAALARIRRSCDGSGN